MKALFSILMGLLLCIPAAQAQTGPTPEQVLGLVDQVRAPGPDFTFSVSAKLINKPDAIENTFEVMVREKKKSLVKYLKPVKQRGRVLLMDGPDMWIFIPGTSRSLRISPAQQLVGGVSHADVARVVFSLDYAAEAVETVEEDGKTLYKLALTAKGTNTPYRTITLYCTQQYEPTKAEFFSLSGKLLRTAYFEGYTMVLGKMRPMSIRMISAIAASENVVLSYDKMVVKETPNHFFQPSYLNQIR